MSDFLTDFLSTVQDVSVERLNPVLYQDDNPDVYILAEAPLSEMQLYTFKKMIKGSFGKIAVSLISVLDHVPNEKAIGNGVVKFYKENKIDLKDYIPPWSKVITMGRALYSITQSSDIMPEYFYDYVFNKTYFFDSTHKYYIFPVDNFNQWLFADNFKRHFFKKQFVDAYKFTAKKRRIIPPKLTQVDDPNTFLQSYIGVDCDLAWDLETVGLDMFDPDKKIICLTLSFDGKEGFYLPFEKIDVSTLSKFFKGKKGIGTNLKYDIKWLVQKGVDRDNLEIHGDTLHLGHLLNEMRKNGLKPTTWLYTDLGGYENELDEYIKKYPKAKEDYSIIPHSILYKYATIDPIASYRVHQEMLKQLLWIDEKFPLENSTWSLHKYYYEIIIPTLNTFVDIELDGMRIDVDKLRSTSQELKSLIETKRKQIKEAFGIENTNINIDSTEQLGILLEEKKWEAFERAKKGHYKTNNEILEKWVKLGHKEASLILEYRELCTLMKTFVGEEAEKSGFFQYIKPDGRIHPNFMVAMTNSLRSKCNNPNMQNIPKHSSGYAKKIREFFIPFSDEFVIGESDGAGLQLRLEAQLTQDEAMKIVFTELGGDMHSMTGKEIFMSELTLEEFIQQKKSNPVVVDYRFKSKAVNFSLIFNTTSFSFAKQSLEPEWTLDQAKEYIEKNKLWDDYDFFLSKMKKMSKDIEYAKTFAHYWTVGESIKKKFMLKYRGVAKHIEGVIKFAHANGYVRCPFGPIRRLPELLYVGEDDNPSHTKNLENITTNSPIQTMEATHIYRTMNYTHKKIKENGFKSRLVGSVHDSIVSYKHRDEYLLVSQWEKEAFEMMIPENNGIPLELEVEIADPLKDEYWGFGKEIDVLKRVKKRQLKNQAQ